MGSLVKPVGCWGGFEVRGWVGMTCQCRLEWSDLVGWLVCMGGGSSWAIQSCGEMHPPKKQIGTDKRTVSVPSAVLAMARWKLRKAKQEQLRVLGTQGGCQGSSCAVVCTLIVLRAAAW